MSFAVSLRHRGQAGVLLPHGHIRVRHHARWVLHRAGNAASNAGPCNHGRDKNKEEKQIRTPTQLAAVDQSHLLFLLNPQAAGPIVETVRGPSGLWWPDPRGLRQEFPRGSGVDFLAEFFCLRHRIGSAAFSRFLTSSLIYDNFGPSSIRARFAFCIVVFTFRFTFPGRA